MAFLGGSVPMFRGLAPRLSKEFFTCRQCLRAQDYAPKSSFRRFFTAVPFARGTTRLSASGLTARTRHFDTPIPKPSAWLSTAANVAEEAATKAKKSSFPDVSDKKVAYWLLGSAVSVFGIVVFGGLTRLTESG
jgi:cytochrome c oxidase assembly protein subunit 15